jgi:hypothetical protein
MGGRQGVGSRRCAVRWGPGSSAGTVRERESDGGGSERARVRDPVRELA